MTVQAHALLLDICRRTGAVAKLRLDGRYVSGVLTNPVRIIRRLHRSRLRIVQAGATVTTVTRAGTVGTELNRQTAVCKVVINVRRALVTRRRAIPRARIVSGTAVLTRRTVHLDVAVLVVRAPIVGARLTTDTDTVAHTTHTTARVVTDHLGTVVAVPVSGMVRRRTVPTARVITVTHCATCVANYLRQTVRRAIPLTAPVATVGMASGCTRIIS